MVKRRQQKLKYYRYCIKQARQLMRSEVSKYKLWHSWTVALLLVWQKNYGVGIMTKKNYTPTVEYHGYVKEIKRNGEMFYVGKTCITRRKPYYVVFGGDYDRQKEPHCGRKIVDEKE